MPLVRCCSLFLGEAVTVPPPCGRRLGEAVTACPTLVRRPTLVPSLPIVRCIVRCIENCCTGPKTAGKPLYNVHASPRAPCVAIQLYSAIQRYTLYSYTSLYTIRAVQHPSYTPLCVRLVRVRAAKRHVSCFIVSSACSAKLSVTTTLLARSTWPTLTLYSGLLFFKRAAGISASSNKSHRYLELN